MKISMKCANLMLYINLLIVIIINYCVNKIHIHFYTKNDKKETPDNTMITQVHVIQQIYLFAFEFEL